MQNKIDPSKPVVQIKNCFFVGLGHLGGIPVDYPDNHMAYPGAISNNLPVVTSKIVQQFSVGDTEYVETARTTYQILNWV